MNKNEKRKNKSKNIKKGLKREEREKRVWQERH